MTEDNGSRPTWRELIEQLNLVRGDIEGVRREMHEGFTNVRTAMDAALCEYATRSELAAAVAERNKLLDLYERRVSAVERTQWKVILGVAGGVLVIIAEFLFRHLFRA